MSIGALDVGDWFLQAKFNNISRQDEQTCNLRLFDPQLKEKISVINFCGLLLPHYLFSYLRNQSFGAFKQLLFQFFLKLYKEKQDGE